MTHNKINMSRIGYNHVRIYNNTTKKKLKEEEEEPPLLLVKAAILIDCVSAFKNKKYHNYFVMRFS